MDGVIGVGFNGYLAHVNSEELINYRKVTNICKFIVFGYPFRVNSRRINVDCVGFNGHFVGAKIIFRVLVNYLDGNDTLVDGLEGQIAFAVIIVPAVVRFYQLGESGIVIVAFVGGAFVGPADYLPDVVLSGRRSLTANFYGLLWHDRSLVLINEADLDGIRNLTHRNFNYFVFDLDKEVAGIGQLIAFGNPFGLNRAGVHVPGVGLNDESVGIADLFLGSFVNELDGDFPGLAHDLAGDGGIASDFPSFRLGAPGQHERPFGVVGVIMPVRDLLIIGGKNEAVIRLDGANARREVYNNNAVVQIQMETLVGVLDIFVDAVKDYGKLIQLILGRVTGLVGRRLGLLSLVNRGGGRSGHFADGDGVIHGLTGVRLRHGVGVVNDHGAISRDIDSDVVTAFAVSGNVLKMAVLAVNLDGAAASPHGVGDNDVPGGDVAVVGDGDSVLKHIANSGRTLAVGNGNGLSYVELGHRLGARLFAAFVVNFSANYGLIFIITVVCTNGGTVTRNDGDCIGEAVIDYIVCGVGFCNINHSNA